MHLPILQLDLLNSSLKCSILAGGQCPPYKCYQQLNARQNNRKIALALIPQPLLPGLGEGEPE
jgi:hypothetical protein